MKAICKSCGSTLTPETVFCSGCGTPVAPSTEPARKNRKWPWILALILLFVLGFLLGRLMAPKCPLCPAPATTGTGGDPGGGGGGGGHPGRGAGGDGDHDKGGGSGASGSGRVLGDSGRVDGSGSAGSAGRGQGTGDMVGGGNASANGTTIGHGNVSSAAGASGADDSGGGGGISNPGTSPNEPQSDPDAKKRTEAGVWRLAAGAPVSAAGLDQPQSNGKDASVKVLSAHDFSYDKTGLPRYLDANQAVFSAMSYDVPGRTDTYGSASGIVSGSAFDDVVGWYRKNLPAGWSNSAVSDLNRLGAVAQQLSPDKIMQMFAAPNGGTPEKSAGDIPATATADRIRLSMFSPPAGTKGDPGVMIVQRDGKPVTILMKTHTSP